MKNERNVTQSHARNVHAENPSRAPRRFCDKRCDVNNGHSFCRTVKTRDGRRPAVAAATWCTGGGGARARRHVPDEGCPAVSAASVPRRRIVRRRCAGEGAAGRGDRDRGENRLIHSRSVYAGDRLSSAWSVACANDVFSLYFFFFRFFFLFSHNSIITTIIIVQYRVRVIL